MLEVLKTSIASAVEKAKIIVNSPESKALAQEHLTTVRKYGKQLADAVKALKAPHQSAIKDIDAAAKPLKELLDERDNGLEQALLTYKRQCELEAAKAQAKILNKYEKDVRKAEDKAIAEGKPVPFIPPPAVIAGPANSEAVGDSKQTVMKRKAWRVRIAGAEVADPEGLTARTCELHRVGIPLE